MGNKIQCNSCKVSCSESSLHTYYVKKGNLSKTEQSKSIFFLLFSNTKRLCDNETEIVPVKFKEDPQDMARTKKNFWASFPKKGYFKMMTYIYSTYLPAAVLVAVPKYEDLPLPMPSTRIRLWANCPSGKKDSWKTTKNADIISKLAIMLITSHIDYILISSVPQYYMFIDNPPFSILRPSIYVLAYITVFC